MDLLIDYAIKLFLIFLIFLPFALIISLIAFLNKPKAPKKANVEYKPDAEINTIEELEALVKKENPTEEFIKYVIDIFNDKFIMMQGLSKSSKELKQKLEFITMLAKLDEFHAEKVSDWSEKLKKTNKDYGKEIDTAVATALQTRKAKK